MELHERIGPSRGDKQERTLDPFADVKNRIHLAIIEDLGRQIFNTEIDRGTLQARVTAEIGTRLAQETAISRDDRAKLAAEIADDILGHGPLERLLADDSVTEIMVNGPYDIWIERKGKLIQTPVRFTDESHLRRIINKMVSQIGRRIDESSPRSRVCHVRTASGLSTTSPTTRSATARSRSCWPIRRSRRS